MGLWLKTLNNLYKTRRNFSIFRQKNPPFFASLPKVNFSVFDKNPFATRKNAFFGNGSKSDIYVRNFQHFIFLEVNIPGRGKRMEIEQNLVEKKEGAFSVVLLFFDALFSGFYPFL